MVRVNGEVARKSTVVRAGDVVTFVTPPAPPGESADTAMLALLHVDDAIVVVDKPPGLPTTIGTAGTASLAAALAARFPEMASLDARHAGLVHRLDTGTSGLLVAARTPSTFARLRAAFAAKRVDKEYLAVVVGRIDARHVVTHALARHSRSRGRMVIARHTARAWAAETEVTPIGGDADLTLVRLRMRTGVTHQLRVHLASLGHPILGDRRYGTAASDVPSPPTDPRWHFLHARTLAIGNDEPDAPPHRFATPFPAHWDRLFVSRGWKRPTD